MGKGSRETRRVAVVEEPFSKRWAPAHVKKSY